MNKKPLGRLQRVELREAWASESADFTPWLAREENLKLLGEAIGIELECEAQEKEVGPFRADILCKDTTTDNWVIIENQLADTDHKHLGQLLTYAAGLEAVTIVWIAESFKEEHRAALDWLNENTNEKINLFGLEIELWRIGDSPIAPKFNIISQPNDWSRTIQQSASRSGVSEHRQLQLKYWTTFFEYMKKQKSFIRCHKPAPLQWRNYSIGKSGIHLDTIISTGSLDSSVKGPEVRVELYLSGSNAKQVFAALEKQKDSLEKALGFPLVWQNSSDMAMCKLYIRKDAEVRDETKWPQQFEWFRQHLEKMHKVFAPVVKDLEV